MTDTPTLSELFDKLTAQGSPDQIALFLETQQIQAVCGSTSRCAIAEYIHRETGQTVNTGVFRTGLYTDGSYDNLIAESYHPVVVQNFINRFDKGDYPNLIEEARTRHEPDHR